MTQEKSNIVLIGMPGSGKSTIGVILAKMTARDFVDTDVIIQTSCSRSLQNIVDTEGNQGLRRIEEDILYDHSYRNHVILFSSAESHILPGSVLSYNQGISCD